MRRRSAWCPVPGVTEWGLSSAVAMPTRTADVICTTVVKASLHQASLHQGRWQDGAARAPRVWHRQGISIAIPCCHPLHEGLPQRGFHGNPGQRRGIAFEPHLNDGRCLPEGLRAGDFQEGMRVCPHCCRVCACTWLACLGSGLGKGSPS